MSFGEKIAKATPEHIPHIEIMGGGGLSNAFIALGIPAERTASSSDGRWEVWNIPKHCHEAMCKMNDDEWHDDWGWWRSAEGSNMDAADKDYKINGKPLKAWDGAVRTDFYKDYCTTCDDRLENRCDGTDESICYCFKERNYQNLFRYLCDEIGASTETNVTALCVDLAKQNNMTLAELVSQYM